MLRLPLLLIGMIAMHSTLSHADDYRDAVDAAYCFGADGYTIQHAAKREYVSRLIAKNEDRGAVIDRALRSRQIDLKTVQRMKASGYAEASACFDSLIKCPLSNSTNECQAVCDKLDVCMDEQDQRELDNLMRDQ